MPPQESLPKVYVCGLRMDPEPLPHIHAQLHIRAHKQGTERRVCLLEASSQGLNILRTQKGSSCTCA
jgi:hypothetical protein